MGVTTDPNATLDPGADPQEADTGEGATENTAQDTQQSARTDVDWQSRYRALQSQTAKEREELARLRAQARTDEAAPPDQGRTERMTPDDSLLAESWALAQAVHGEEAIAAYDAVYQLLDTAATPADFISALEAYHEARSRGATPNEAAGAAQEERSL